METMFGGVFWTVTVTGVAAVLAPLESKATTVTAYEPSVKLDVFHVIEHAPDVICGPTFVPPA